MKKYALVVSRVLVLTLAANSTSYAWNNRGHMMVAAVAYKSLTPETKSRVDALLLLNPDRGNWLALIPGNVSAANKQMMVFMIAATWPDRIKSNPSYHVDGSHEGNRPPPEPLASQNIGYQDFAMHKYWHFVDVPFATDSTNLPSIPVPNAQSRIEDFRKVLASGEQDALKSYDLSWFLHLVGDVHQPLHCTTRVSAAQQEGDDGGNEVRLSGRPDNLHSFWDGVLGGGDSPSSALRAISSLPSAPSDLASDLDVSHWVNESFAAAEQTAYMQPPIGSGAGPFSLTQAYKTAARKVAQMRVALAGARMATILNQELK